MEALWSRRPRLGHNPPVGSKSGGEIGRPGPGARKIGPAATATGRYWAGVVNKHIKLSPDRIGTAAGRRCAEPSPCAKAAEIATSSGAMSVEVSSA